MKKSLMTKWQAVGLVLIAAAVATTASAQKPGVTGGAAVGSEAGRAVALRAVEMSAQVIAIDKATRTVTLKGPKGNVRDIVAGDEVKNFDQIQLGDAVVARYVEALTLELKKTRTAGGGVAVREEAGKAKAGEKPAVAGGRQIVAIADVTAVDPKRSTITLKGPRGNELVLDVQNPDHFKVVKKGDQVEVTYTEALALSVEPVPKATPPKAK